jgi:hypothetical protein
LSEIVGPELSKQLKLEGEVKVSRYCSLEWMECQGKMRDDDVKQRKQQGEEDGGCKTDRRRVRTMKQSGGPQSWRGKKWGGWAAGGEG